MRRVAGRIIRTLAELMVIGGLAAVIYQRIVLVGADKVPGEWIILFGTVAFSLGILVFMVQLEFETDKVRKIAADLDKKDHG